MSIIIPYAIYKPLTKVVTTSNTLKTFNKIVAYAKQNNYPQSKEALIFGLVAEIIYKQ